MNFETSHALVAPIRTDLSFSSEIEKSLNARRCTQMSSCHLVLTGNDVSPFISGCMTGKLDTSGLVEHAENIKSKENRWRNVVGCV